jgi:hypothetical protein
LLQPSSATLVVFGEHSGHLDSSQIQLPSAPQWHDRHPSSYVRESIGEHCVQMFVEQSHAPLSVQ